MGLTSYSATERGFIKKGRQLAEDSFKMQNLNDLVTKVCFSVSESHYANIGLGNGLALNRHQSTTWTNDDHFTDNITY